MFCLEGSPVGPNLLNDGFRGKWYGMQKKKLGQVYTPDYLVRNILDISGYCGTRILDKHIIDNSAGNGAFLCEAARRYCNAFLSASSDTGRLKHNLEWYVHGVEIETSAYLECLENLDAAVKQYGVEHVRWDVLCGDTLGTDNFDGRMDFVVGNPPYIRVHNLGETYGNAKHYAFAQGGMTDMFLVFFEIGFRMLKSGGRLCYITPGSWLNSLAGKTMREYVMKTECLAELVDLGHYQAFDATAYTLISLFEKDRRHGDFLYSEYDGEKRGKREVEKLALNRICIGGNFCLATSPGLALLKAVRQTPCVRRAVVKNGFATLADSVFIKSAFPFSEHVIPVVKASTGKWYKAFFPYGCEGSPIDFAELCQNTQVRQYLEANRSRLQKGRSECNGMHWYLYGRTQAIKDVCRRKIAVNTCVKDLKSIKISVANAGEGVYGGLYVLTEESPGTVKGIIMSDGFLDYVKLLKKYKSGGYYTFSSKDLEAYLNFMLNKHYENYE